MEEEPPEDALAFFAQLYDDAPKEQTSETVSISENEIYFKRKPLTEEQKKHLSLIHISHFQSRLFVRDYRE